MWAELLEIGNTCSEVTGAGSGLQALPRPRPQTHPRPAVEWGPLEQGQRLPCCPLRWWVWPRCSSWAGSWMWKQGIPQRGPSLAWGWTCTKGDLFFLGMPAPSQTYLQPHSGDSYTHTWLHRARKGWEVGGCRQAWRSAIKKNLVSSMPCHIPFTSPHLTPSDQDTPTASCTTTGTQFHSHNHPLPENHL